MGLDDIDEDVARCEPKRDDPRALDDLFDGLSVAPRSGEGATQESAARVKNETSSAHDPLDYLFSGPPPACAPSKSDDLFDFSRPVERKQHKDGSTLLDYFGGKAKAEARSTLSTVATPSNSRVTAQFLSLMNYYDVLSVSKDADIDEIKRKYKKKALELHPDKVGSSQTPEEAALFKMITKAYETLSDEVKRKEYDSMLQGGCHKENWLQHV